MFNRLGPHQADRTPPNNSAEVTPSVLPQAEKLQYFLEPWMQLAQDPGILDTVRGYQIPFSELPPNRQIPAFTSISAEVGELLCKQAISRAASDYGFISNSFLVPKGKRKWRPILNLKDLNLYTKHQTSRWKISAV